MKKLLAVTIIATGLIFSTYWNSAADDIMFGYEPVSSSYLSGFERVGAVSMAVVSDTPLDECDDELQGVFEVPKFETVLQQVARATVLDQRQYLDYFKAAATVAFATPRRIYQSLVMIRMAI